MPDTTCVNLHCHSTCSDGTLPPEQLAERLVAAGVKYAALTDHDTLEGYNAFRDVLVRRGVGVVPGVELTTRNGTDEIHLLAYGFDPAHPELLRSIAAVHRQNDLSMHALVGSLRKIGARTRTGADEPESPPATNGWLDTAEAIALVHRAGGRVFLAHPLATQPDAVLLEQLLLELKDKGLDGIEAVYQPYPPDTRASLIALADKHDMLVSAGTDFHDPTIPDHDDVAISMPPKLWRKFREGLQRPTQRITHAAPVHLPAPSSSAHWRSFLLRIGVPVFLVIALFLFTIFAIIIPQFEAKLLDRKREMIKELTNSASSILTEYQREERAGRITRQEAQSLAKSRIEGLRYGKEGKDYFWITDLHPRMVMHPYRSDLNGKDVSDFRDARGHRIFVEFAELVKRKHEGYVEYVWQWKDDPARLATKESYIKAFEPWGWVIGTGIYIGDVTEEISGITRTVINWSIGISATVALLLLFVAQQSMKIERQRFSAQQALREWNERYKSLVEAATEGTAMILDNRCTYANRTLLEMLGYSEAEFDLLELDDLLPGEDAARRFREKAADETASSGFEASLRRRDGEPVRCVINVNPIEFAGQSGWIVIAKDLQRHAEMTEAVDTQTRRAGRLVDNVPVGILRVVASRKGQLVEANRTAREMLAIPSSALVADHRLVDYLDVPDDLEEILGALDKGKSVVNRTVPLRVPGSESRVASLSAVLARSDDDARHYVDILIEDATDRKKAEAETRGLIATLETSLMFLHEPISHFLRETVTCDMNQPISRAATLMSRRDSTALLVTSESGEVIGIVTDRDLRERILAADQPPSTPVFKVMSSPVATISDSALIYEALLMMEQKGVQHLVVTDDAGRPLSIVRNKELLQFPRYGSVVLTREIQRAATVEDVAATRARLPALVGALLDSGARPRNVTRIITSVSDAVTQRLVSLAIETLGPPPAAFAFIVLGSEGREEQTLVTDQDNAIIHEDVDPAAAAEVSQYFQQLGNLVCDWLNQAGYRYCPGNFMAKNPMWCQPLSRWRDYFEAWITQPEPQQLMEFSIFFDLRSVYGTPDLVPQLRTAMFEIMHETPAFFTQFAHDAAQYKPPAFGLLAKILAGGGGEQSRQINLKEAMAPV